MRASGTEVRSAVATQVPTQVACRTRRDRLHRPAAHRHGGPRLSSMHPALAPPATPAQPLHRLSPRLPSAHRRLSQAIRWQRGSAPLVRGLFTPGNRCCPVETRGRPTAARRGQGGGQGGGVPCRPRGTVPTGSHTSHTASHLFTVAGKRRRLSRAAYGAGAATGPRYPTEKDGHEAQPRTSHRIDRLARLIDKLLDCLPHTGARRRPHSRSAQLCGSSSTAAAAAAPASGRVPASSRRNAPLLHRAPIAQFPAHTHRSPLFQTDSSGPPTRGWAAGAVAHLLARVAAFHRSTAVTCGSDVRGTRGGSGRTQCSTVEVGGVGNDQDQEHGAGQPAALPQADGPLVDVTLPDRQHLYAVVKSRRREPDGWRYDLQIHLPS